MRLLPAIALKSFFLLSIVLAALDDGLARERGPRVEVACPSPPIAVELAEQRVLVYELHITNFDVVPLTLNRLEIFADTDKSRPLKTLSGDALLATMLEVGSSMEATGSETIDPGRRAVAFLWIELRSDTRV